MKEDVGISKLKKYANSIRMVLTQEVNNITPKIKISTFIFMARRAIPIITFHGVESIYML